MSPPPVSRAHWALAGAFVVLLALHMGMARQSPGPILYDDGTAYLAQARYLAGQENPPDLTHTAFYHPGYPLVLVPAHVVASDPATQHRLVLWTNGFLAAGLVVPLFLLALGPLGLPPGRAVVAAAVAAAHPAVLLQSNFEWAESLLVVAVAAWALLVHRVLRRPGPGGAIALAVGAAGLYLVHQRAVVAAPVALGVLGWLVARRRLAPWGLGAAVVTLAAGAGGTRLLGEHLRSALWSMPRPTLEGDVLGTVLDPSTWPTVAVHAAGQLWYLVAASLGLAVLGVVTLGLVGSGRWQSTRPEPAPATADAADGGGAGDTDPTDAADGGGAGDTDPGDAADGGGAGDTATADAADDPTADRVWAVAVLALVALTLGLSATFIIRGDRVDHLLYGRYNESVLPVLLVAALALVLRPGRSRAWVLAPAAGAVVALFATVGVLRVARGAEAFTGDVMPLNVLGVLPFHRSHGMIPVGRISLLVLVLIAGVVAVAVLAPRASVAVVACVFVAGAFVAESRTLQPFVTFWSELLTLHEEVIDRTEPGDVVGYDWQSFRLTAFNGYQLWLHDRPLVIFDSEVEPPPGRLVIAAVEWDLGDELGADLVAIEREPVSFGLWVLPEPAVPRSNAGHG